MNGMRISVLQTDIEWGRVDINIASAERAIARAPGADMYILPEMFSTGFCTEPAGMAEDNLTSLRWMIETAARIDAAICGSVATAVEGGFANRLYFVKPSG